MAMILISGSDVTANLTKALLKRLPVVYGKSNVTRCAIVLCSLAFLNGCNSTSTPASTYALDTVITTVERMSTDCISQVKNQQTAMKVSTLGQSLSLANAAQQCVADIQYFPKHPDIKTAMQFSALAFVNYVKAGDMQAATQALAKFRADFPQQDLLFADYTSFVDTATVLVKQSEVTPYQLSSLNINPTLRSEITRQRKWSLR
jgi:hypothetical protein